MKIGILGAGRIGGSLAAAWTAAGHDLTVSTRDTIEATAAAADVLLLAVPCSAVAEVLGAAGDLRGKILIDATNNLSGGPDGAEIARLADGAHTVKAFNTVFAQFFADPPAERPSLAIAGANAEAKEVVASLVRAAGFDPVDAGGAEAVPNIEALAKLVIGIAYTQARGPFTYRFDLG